MARMSKIELHHFRHVQVKLDICAQLKRKHQDLFEMFSFRLNKAKGLAGKL